jgi:hypothetical protein
LKVTRHERRIQDRQLKSEFCELVRFIIGSAVGVWLIGTLCALAHGWGSGGL